MKTYYILYYYPPYKIGWTKVYQTLIVTFSEREARAIFKQNNPQAMIKGIEDYPPS